MFQQRRQTIYTIVAITILSVLFILSYRISILNNPVLATILAISFFSAIAILVIAINPQLLDPERKIQKIDDIIVAISIITYTVISIGLISGYGTDDMEYISEAIQYLFSATNPYMGFYHPYNVQPTYLLSGNVASNFIYPPLSFLLYVPFYWILTILHFKLYYLNIVNIIFQDLLSIIIYLKGREKRDPVATLPVIFGFVTAGILSPSFAGVNSTIWATFLALSYIYDDEKSGIFLALANSFSQVSWIITPFMLIYKKNQNLSKIIINYIIVILAINLPFFVWNPIDFMHIFTLDSSTIPVAVTGFTILNFTTLFTVEPWFFTCSIGIIGILSIYVYLRFFNTLKETLWIYPLFILWFGWRTLTSYFLMWPQLAFLSIFNIQYNYNKLNLQMTTFSITKSLKVELLGVLLISLASITTLGFVSHVQYVSEDPLQIVKVNIPNRSNLNSTDIHINSLTILVKNTKNESINITLVRVSIPNSLNMVWNFTKGTIPPNSTIQILAYTNNPQLYINSSTFTVEVYSNYFISSYTVILFNDTNSSTILRNSTSTK